MLKLLRNSYFLVGLALVLLGLNFIPFHVIKNDETSHTWEQFDPSLVKSLTSVDDVLHYTDSISKSKNITTGTLAYAIELDNVIKSRFVHGYSHYGFSENWVAASAGYIWRDFSAIVIPDDLLKYPYGSCSQQSIVLMECMKKRGISYRTIYFPTHFALEALVNKQWFFFDPDLEPTLTLATITNLDSLSKTEKLYTIYKAYSDSLSLATTLSSYTYGGINAKQAPKSVLFHKFTKFLSRTLWLLPLLAMFFIRRKRIRSSRLSNNDMAGPDKLNNMKVKTTVKTSIVH